MGKLQYYLPIDLGREFEESILEHKSKFRTTNNRR